MTEETAFREISDRSALPADPLVSVQMLTYKHESYIAQAIEGVVAQVCDFAFELIISEDCSPDGTLAIVLDYQRRYPNLIRVITGKVTIGPGANSERAYSANRGCFVTFCEGDDYWCDPSRLRRQCAFLRRNPEVSLVCHASNFLDDRTGKIIGKVHTALSSRFLTQRELVLGDGGLITTASIVVRRSVLDQLPRWCSQAPVGDYPLVLGASLFGKIAYLHRVMSVYRINARDSWSQRRISTLENRWLIAEGLEKFLHDFDRDCGYRYRRETRKMASKYYSDALVRQAADRKLLRFHLEQVSSKLTWLDGLFASIAVSTGIRLGLIKTLLRKIDSARRLLINELFAERFADRRDFVD